MDHGGHCWLSAVAWKKWNIRDVCCDLLWTPPQTTKVHCDSDIDSIRWNLGLRDCSSPHIQLLCKRCRMHIFVAACYCNWSVRASGCMLMPSKVEVPGTLKQLGHESLCVGPSVAAALKHICSLREVMLENWAALHNWQSNQEPALPFVTGGMCLHLQLWRGPRFMPPPPIFLNIGWQWDDRSDMAHGWDIPHLGWLPQYTDADRALLLYTTCLVAQARYGEGKTGPLPDQLELPFESNLAYADDSLDLLWTAQPGHSLGLIVGCMHRDVIRAALSPWRAGRLWRKAPWPTLYFVCCKVRWDCGLAATAGPSTTHNPQCRLLGLVVALRLMPKWMTSSWGTGCRLYSESVRPCACTVLVALIAKPLHCQASLSDDVPQHLWGGTTPGNQNQVPPGFVLQHPSGLIQSLGWHGLACPRNYVQRKSDGRWPWTPRAKYGVTLQISCRLGMVPGTGHRRSMVLTLA